MALLKFNKKELVNLSYSTRREIILANRTGAYCNTSISLCNTRKYHGLLAVPIDCFGENKYILLSSLDESLVIGGRQFNLGIHCYGDVYEPRGHKYIIDFNADVTPEITYKVGDVVFRKRLLMAPDAEELLIEYELVSAPEGSNVSLILKPFLSFRKIHELTHENSEARTGYRDVNGGVAYNLYNGFPDLFLQINRKADYRHLPDWYRGITYSDEYRRGFDCREDLLVPGNFVIKLSVGKGLIVSASTKEIDPKSLTKKFKSYYEHRSTVTDYESMLKMNAENLKYVRGGRHKITAGFSWLYAGLLRETIAALPGLTLYANGSTKDFELILDDLIAAEQERLYHRTTQVEAPLQLTDTLQQYIRFAHNEKHVWNKYKDVLKGILRSYLPGRRNEIQMVSNGLLWARLPHRALTWMNAYCNGEPVTERPGFQVEVNAFWYNAICFALEMEKKYGNDSEFIAQFEPIREKVLANYTPTFWNERWGYLADYVYDGYADPAVRPNQLYAAYVEYSPISEEIIAKVMKSVRDELVTARGLRTLSPRNPAYKGVYEGSQIDRDLAYQQGSCWTFLLAPYVVVIFKMFGSAMYKKVEHLSEGFQEDYAKHGVGCFSELYDGDPPHEPHGAISSAMSTAALLRINYLMKQYKEEKL
ncbi:MAG: glycogen debranching enzyme N-terminal domain-containing protein [Bacteroidales bacterium]|nr:glycogen debranching enzyme N-terminal domain-containing protein [Bacteroidales bacterium]